MCSAKPADRQKYHPAVIVSVDHKPQVQHRYQVYFDSADSHSTQYADTDAVIISPDQKAMLLALRDADSDPADFPSDAFMDEPDPATYRQARLSPNWRQWHKAIQSEIDGILQPDRADPVTAFPPGSTVLPSKFVFKLKKLTDGSLDKFKARCTTRGDMDRTFYEEAETFAPTPQLTTFRLLLALCLTHRLMPYHYDVSRAFLQALIPEDERYYVRFPKGYVHPLGYVGAYMKKALYGHRTSGRLWSETAHRFMTDRYPTLSRSTYDECLYIGWIDGQLFIVLIYVDDFIVACADERSRARFHTDIMSTFQATYSGVLNQFLQLKVDVQTETLPTGESYPTKIELSHERSITNLCAKFSIDTDKQPPRSPMTEGLSLPIPPPDAIDRDYTLAMAIDPTTPQLTAFCDSDHAGDTATRNSVSGYCLYFHGMLIDWWSKKQKSCTALHSTEAEYVAMSEACTSAPAIYNTLTEFFPSAEPITINVDNSAVQTLVTQRALSTKLKHIAVRYHAVRNWCQGPLTKFTPVWIPTDDNQADIFTKALPTTKHGVPIIDKFTARLLDIKDRGVKLKEKLRAAEAQKLHAQQQQLPQQQRQHEIVLASLQRQNLIG
ncbi:hypothetical protein CYMTET_54558 [Cymbomonas tetramitiformis]|uniref:Reverse transcriptase Ty1/copia-type domain-containing protein n=1 Tax=Cymbomonas tetramitiformis TaxID=36881 RepID=A0AAE0BEZ6_9CHLO|nr:hypothetical protein CYMTET_54558 [Cymbomonas tetramitiformis]